MKLLVLGINHTKGSLDIREQFCLSKENHSDLQKLLLSYDYITEACSLSTCNRTEVYMVTNDSLQAKKKGEELLGKIKHISFEDNVSYFYTHEEDKAIEHLFRVSASLDSMVIGESQILGQVKEAFMFANNLRSIGPLLNKLFHASFHAAKLIRTETRLGERPVSIASCALSLAKKIFTHLENKTALLIGLGEMGTEVALLLHKEKIGSFFALNRTYQKTVLLSERIPITPLKWEEQDKALEEADIVITCTHADSFVLTKDHIKNIMKKRKQNPLFCIDIAVPRNIDPTVQKIDNTFLYDLDSLNLVIEENKKERTEEAQKAQKIIEEKVAEFIAWRESLDIVPTIKKLRERLDHIKEEEIARYLKNGNAREVEEITHMIFNKFIHTPLSQIKETHANKEYFYIEALQKLFKL